MKKSFFLLTMFVCGLAGAQTNGTLTVPTNAPAVKAKPHAPTEIVSDAADFDLNIHQAIYRGHVKVTDPEVKLTCDWMVVDLPAAGNHLNHVLVDTNVVVDFMDKGQTNHVTAARAVYDYKVVGAVTNETVTFTGNPVVEMPDMTIYSEPLVWDRTANKYHFTGPRMISNDHGGTNSSPMIFLK